LNADQKNTDKALAAAGTNVVADNLGNACDPDIDGDGFSNAHEIMIGTDPTDNCPDNTSDDAWPPDFDKNKVINILDVGEVLPPYFGLTSSSPDWDPRKDLVVDGVINILDVGMTLPPIFGQTCSP